MFCVYIPPDLGCCHPQTQAFYSGFCLAALDKISCFQSCETKFGMESLGLRLVFIFHGKLYLSTCSVELPARGVHVHAMKNVFITKWYIALSIKIGVLENH